MTENAPRWPMMVGTYLEVEGCLGAALMGLLGGDIAILARGDLENMMTLVFSGFSFILHLAHPGGDVDFKVVDGFVMTLETGFTFVLVNVNRLGGGGAGALIGPGENM